MSSLKFKKILVVKNRALGDSIFGLSVFSYLKKTFPDCHLTYALPDWIVKLYQNVDSDVDSFLPFNLKGAGGQFTFLNAIRKGGYDAILELHDNSRSHRILEVARFLFRIPLFGHNHHLDYRQMTGVFEQGIRKSIIQRDLDGVYSFVRFFNPKAKVPSFLDFSPRLKSLGESHKDTVVLGIVATRDEKKWPIECFAELVRLMQEKGYKRFLVPVSPSEVDQEASRELSKLTENTVEVVNVPLSELPQQLAQAHVYIGNDTGMKHISAALGLRTITIFGPEEPLEWHPYEKSEHPYFWVYGCDFRSEMVDVCLLTQFDRSINISSITPKEVLSAL